MAPKRADNAEVVTFDDHATGRRLLLRFSVMANVMDKDSPPWQRTSWPDSRRRFEEPEMNLQKPPLPPYGNQFIRGPHRGIRVAIGPGAWDFVKAHWHPIMVLPMNCDPSEFSWPVDGRPALIHERGQCDDIGLEAMAYALLIAGSPSVVAIREALLNEYDPRVFFDRGVIDVAA